MKKNTKRFLCALLSGVMMLGLLTACGGSRRIRIRRIRRRRDLRQR